jgi:hypothetical protein
MTPPERPGKSSNKIVCTLICVVVVATAISNKRHRTINTSQKSNSVQNFVGISSQADEHSNGSFVAMSVHNDDNSNFDGSSKYVTVPSLVQLIPNINGTLQQTCLTTTKIAASYAHSNDICLHGNNSLYGESMLLRRSDMLRNKTGISAASTTAHKFFTTSDDNPDISSIMTDDNESVCRVYMAPSTIPGAGYGLFAGISFQSGDLVTPGDGVVPIYDLVFQNGNDEHENTFLWDEYVWSSSTFTAMDIPDKSMEAASFGIGALPNCFFALLNVEDSSHHGRDNANLELTNSPGLGAFSPWHDRKSYATRHIHIGSELFVDYGYAYFTSRTDTIGPVPFLKHYKIADQLLHKLKGITNNLYQTNDGSANEISNMKEDSYQLTRSVFNVWGSRVLYAMPNNVTMISDVLQHGGTIQKDYLRSIRNIEYLKTYGACMDHLRVAPSHQIPHAGRGVFASRSFMKGSIVATVPLIHIPERNVMTIYEKSKIDVNFQQEEPVRNTSNPIHQQLLLNYCFGHEQSTLLLCPYGIVSSLINHAPTEANEEFHTPNRSDYPVANVQIKWSAQFTKHPEWWSMNITEWAYSYRTGLAFEYVALRHITANEEIFIDYGVEWQNAWEKHVSDWEPIQRSVDILNADLDSIIPTEKEWMWQSGDININPHAVNLWCYNAYRELQGLPATDAVAYPCKAILRQYNNNSNSHSYTAEIMERRQNSDYDSCDEILDEILWSLPRDAFTYGGYNDVYDTNQYVMPSTFRHEIAIPDYLMPRMWKNM